MKYVKLGLVLLMPLAMAAQGCSRSQSLSVDYGAKGAAELQNMDTRQSKGLLDAAPNCCNNLSQINYEQVTKPGVYDYYISPQKQALVLSTGKSFTQGIRLPKTDGEIKVTISSTILSTVFIPHILVLDDQFQPIRLVGSDKIKYTKATLLSADRYLGKFIIQKVEKAKYLLIYTTSQSMSSETQLASLDSEALESGGAKIAERVYMNKPVSHSAIGAVRLAFEFVAEGQEENKSLSVVKPAVTNIPATTADLTSTIEPETAAMFTQLIETAVKSGDLNKAMRIVGDAEKAGYGQARQVLIKAL
jgi:maltose operon protein